MDLDLLKDVLRQLATYAMEDRDYEVTPNTLQGQASKKDQENQEKQEEYEPLIK